MAWIHVQNGTCRAAVAQRESHAVEIVGSGPNGLAAGIELARAGCRVAISEQASSPGGGMRTQSLTLDGYLHDVCATVTPLAAASPFFATLGLERFGLQWVQPPVPLAHPLDEAETVYLERDLGHMADGLGTDGSAYLKLFDGLVGRSSALMTDLLAPLRFPRHPFLLARFGLNALLSAERLAVSRFNETRTRALIAGLAAHSMLPLDRPISSAFALVLAVLGHAVGWPQVAGGTQRLAEALSARLVSMGGEIRVNDPIGDLDQVSSSAIVLLGLSPRGVIEVVGDRFPRRYRESLSKYRYGPGVFKVDWALDGPAPWRDSRCMLAGTLHLGGTLKEIALAESQVWRGVHPENPFVIFVQPSLFDPRRAPPGKHTAWAYCHVPHGSEQSMTDRIEAQVERFAPGFKRRILARSTKNAKEMENYNPNYIGGDINGGVQDLRGHYLRPAARLDPYRTPLGGLFICSSATPPGGGVHGMCGYHAARSALRWMKTHIR